MKPGDAAALLALGALWGASFIFIRIAAPVLGPFVLPDLRVLLAAAVLLVWGIAIRQRPIFRARWRRYLLLGALNAALPFVLVATAAVYLPASLLAILNATMPLFTALVAAIRLGEPFTRRRVGGLAVGLAGVVALVGWSPLGLTPPVVVAVGCSLTASLCYAIGGVYARTAFVGVPVLDLAAGQQVAAGVLLLPLALADRPPAPPAPPVVLAVVALALPCTALAYLLYFRLIERVGPTATHSVTYLVPGFGLLWGALFLGERITPGIVAGLGVVLLGVLLTTGVDLAALGRRVRRTPGQLLARDGD